MPMPSAPLTSTMGMMGMDRQQKQTGSYLTPSITDPSHLAFKQKHRQHSGPSSSHFIIKKIITSKQKDFLYGPDNPRDRHFYLLPKIHKDPHTWTIPYEVPPGRSIVSDCNSASYHISNYIEHFLGPLSTKHPSYIVIC